MNRKLERVTILGFLTIALVMLITIHAWTSRLVRVFGTGEVENAFFEVVIDERLEHFKGTLVYTDYNKERVVFGEVDNVIVETSSKIKFTGSYISIDNSKHTFEAILEDLGDPGNGIDRFSIALSDGYTNTGTIAYGDIKIIL